MFLLRGKEAYTIKMVFGFLYCNGKILLLKNLLFPNPSALEHLSGSRPKSVNRFYWNIKYLFRMLYLSILKKGADK